MNIIEINKLNYLNVFSDFSTSFEKNKLTTISGPNNCGKTTLLKILSKKINSNSDIIINNNNINDYKINEYYKLVKSVIPLEEEFINYTVEEELQYTVDRLFLNKEEKNSRIKSIIKNLYLNGIRKKEIKDLNDKEFILLQLADCIITTPKILLIDDLSPYLDSEEIKKIIIFLKSIISKYDMTIIINSLRLEDIIETDKIMIINNSEVILEGNPIDILQKDNILNKAGIKVPFMIDLSVKLKDYNLIDEVELDMNRMTNKLWN